MNIKHFHLLSWVHDRTDAPKYKNHAQDGGALIEAEDQRPAILPWFSCSGWRPSLIVSHGHLARHAQRPDCCWTLRFEHEPWIFMLGVYEHREAVSDDPCKNAR
jgi:hypothetical protein